MKAEDIEEIIIDYDELYAVEVVYDGTFFYCIAKVYRVLMRIQ
jgi:hypothetical protein